MKTLLLILSLLISPILSQSALASSDNTTEPAFSDAELAQILAPIALYPDSVLSHVLIAATYPLEVVQAGRWLIQHPDPETAAEALAEQDWDASVKALTPFPELLERLNEDLDWMRDLGDAFLADEQRLLASVQWLRAQAEQADSFEHAEHIQLSREQGNIIIEPSDSEVVYLPYYDSYRVYGNWRYAGHPPHNWIGWNSYWGRDHRSPFDWHGGVYLSTSFFFNAVHWSDRRIRVANHHSRYWRQHSRRQSFDRNHHRRQLLSDQSAGYWRHNPKHRRGVAYAGRHSAAGQHAREQRKALRGGKQGPFKYRNERSKTDQQHRADNKQRHNKHWQAAKKGQGKHRNEQPRHQQKQLTLNSQLGPKQRPISTQRPGLYRSEQGRHPRQLVAPTRPQQSKHSQLGPQRPAKQATALTAARQHRANRGSGKQQANVAAKQRRAVPGRSTASSGKQRRSPQRHPRLASGHHR